MIKIAKTPSAYLRADYLLTDLHLEVVERVLVDVLHLLS